MVLVIFAETLLTNYAKFFEIDNASKGADAIICLSGGKQTRIPKTVELWNLGYSDKVFLTDEKKRNSEFRYLEISNLQFAKEVSRIKKIDIPWEVIPNRDGGATSTFDEAVDVVSFAKLRNWKRIIIVTDFFHTRRALHAFGKVFEESGIRVQVAGVGNDILNAHNWWESDSGILAYFSETIKFPVYLFWNVEPSLVENH